MVRVKKRIAPAVVVALEDKDHLPAGNGARQTRGEHHGLGSRIRESHQIDAGKEPLELCGRTGRHLGGEAKLTAALRDLANHRLDNRLRAVAENQRPVGHV